MRSLKQFQRKQLTEVAKTFGLPPSQAQRLMEDVAQLVYAAIDTPRSLACSILLKHQEYGQLVGLSCRPIDYLDTERGSFADDYQATSFLKKYPGFSSPELNPEVVAWEKFQAAEEQCRTTNQRFREMRSGGNCPPVVNQVLHLARRKIARWLGDLDARSWALRCKFGPGSDNLTKGRRISTYNKLHNGVSATRDFVDGARSLVQSHWTWTRAILGETWEVSSPVSILVSVASGNKIAFVPKTALTHRSIAVEPQMNIFAQLGLGAILRARLKKAGLNLDSQLTNQLLAHRGSVKGDVATIDLSSASDTLSTEVVRDLLPPQWFGAMYWCRSHVGTYKRIKILYEKFSSMGNGYTFELESMIFYALALSATEYCGGETNVCTAYGDDIIVPRDVYPVLQEVLSFCGFTVNQAKSFWSGPFRESCGVDFWDGTNIRPYFQEEVLSSVESLYRLANGLRRYAFRRNGGSGCDGRFRSAWVLVFSRIPRTLRSLLAPGQSRLVKDWRGDIVPFPWPDVESGDGGLLLNLDEASSSPWLVRARFGLEGWLFSTWSAVPRVHGVGSIENNTLNYALYISRDEQPSIDSQGKVPLRDGDERRLATLLTQSFFDLGEWW